MPEVFCLREAGREMTCAESLPALAGIAAYMAPDAGLSISYWAESEDGVRRELTPAEYAEMEKHSIAAYRERCRELPEPDLQALPQLPYSLALYGQLHADTPTRLLHAFSYADEESASHIGRVCVITQASSSHPAKFWRSTAAVWHKPSGKIVWSESLLRGELN